MKKFSNFCGIFATLLVTTTLILLASCSQDDDYYDSDMYTLAETGTRLVEGDGGDSEGIVVVVYDLTSDIGEHWLKFYQEGNTNDKNLKIHLYALTDSALTHWGGYALPVDNNVRVTSTQAELVSSNSSNVNLRFHIKINYQGYNWSCWTTHTCPISSFYNN